VPRYEVTAYLQVEADDPAEARDIAVAALEYMQDTLSVDLDFVDCFVDLEPHQVEP
jgi:hypothetical protein